MASSSRPLSLFPDLNGPSSSAGPSTPTLTQPSLPTLSVEQVMATQNDNEANHYTLRSCMETVAAVTNLSHRLQNKACEVYQVNAQLSLLQCMYRDARAEICALKAENKELKRQTTSMARFGAPTYLTFDGRRGADSGGGNTVVVLGGSTGDGPSKVDDKKNDKKWKSSATEEPNWLEKTLSETKPVPKLVSIVNPGNPSGTCIPEPLLKRISEICRRAGSWLVIDNAYEYFVYDDFKHSCVEGNHVINLFSFSKAYGMMGWRVGYIAYSPGAEGLRTQLLKVQDNVAICTSMISQHMALNCLEAGREWVRGQVKSLARNKELLGEALSPLGDKAVKGGQGAIYLWANLPDKYPNDFEVVCWFARRHGVLLLPGSACGTSGCIRITYGMLTESECNVAAKRLKRGVEELIRDGMVENECFSDSGQPNILLTYRDSC